MFRPLALFNRNHNAPSLRGDAAADPFFQFHHEMNRLFDDFFNDFGAPSLFASNGGDARPVHIEAKEKKDRIELEAELPGVDEDDIHVELVDNLLTIRGEKKFEQDDEGENGVKRRAWSSFQRSMSLPFDVDPDAIEAKFRNGVLKLTLPKPPSLEAKTKKIAVQRG